MKLPKDLRKKKKRAQKLRTRGSKKGKTGSNVSVKGLNRQMRRKLKNQGIEGMDAIEANRVIIETDDADLVVDDPQVIKVEQQGVEMYQVIGDTREVEKGELQVSEGQISGSISSEEEGLSDEELEEIEEDLKVEITKQDIMLVASQTGVSEEVAENALKEANGDLAKAIMNLKSRV